MQVTIGNSFDKNQHNLVVAGIEQDSKNASLSNNDKKYQITKKTVDDMVNGKSNAQLNNLDQEDKWEILYGIIDHHPELCKKKE